MSDYSNLAILIPCRNEEESLPCLVSELKSCLPGATIIVIDNNSTDKTYEKASAIPKITLQMETTIGKSNAIRKGMSLLDLDIELVSTIDGDLTYSAIDLKQIVDKIHRDASVSMVVGNRLSSFSGFSLLNLLFNWIVVLIVNIQSEVKVRDLLSGLRVWRKTQFSHNLIKSHSFEFETEITLHFIENSRVIKYYPISYTKRKHGKSKLRPLRDASLILISIFKFHRPRLKKASKVKR